MVAAVAAQSLGILGDNYSCKDGGIVVLVAGQAFESALAVASATIVALAKAFVAVLEGSLVDRWSLSMAVGKASFAALVPFVASASVASALVASAFVASAFVASALVAFASAGWRSAETNESDNQVGSCSCRTGDSIDLALVMSPLVEA